MPELVDDDEAAVRRMLERIDRIEATFVEWAAQMDGRAVLIREDAWAYVEACRRRYGRA